jgi:glycosyltransferase involved in cell wall biosynthesis
MYCGGCFRDNALVAALRKQGHEALMVPLYLPLTLDEPDQSEQIPIFYGGINVYLDQKSSLFRRAPRWLHQLLSARPLLHWASGRAAKTQAAEVGELLLSMLRGEEGQQARELTDLIAWLKTQRPPDAICISNALLAGMARRLKAELHAPVVCLLAGEDAFLDSLPEAVRQTAWQTLAERCVDVDLFLPPSRYFGDLMGRRLQLRPNQLALLPNGISLAGYPTPAGAGSATAARAEPGPAPVLGYFARMCREKGLDRLVDAYLLLKKRNELANLRLHIGGGCGPSDEPLVEEQKRKLAAAGVNEHVRFFPNVTLAEKIAFYQGLTVFSVPAHYGEAFGLYVLEALAAGVPVVQPRHAGFPELIESTGGGLLCEPDNVPALADAIASLLHAPERRRQLGERGQQVVHQQFSNERMAENFVRILAQAGKR